MVEHFTTIIIGGGQSGLSISYFLKQAGLDHVIFEKADQPASAWRNRWDSFTLVTPNWMLQLPGAEYQGDHPEAFLDREEVIAYFESYIQHEHLPIRYGIQVSSVEKAQNMFQVKTSQGEFTADNVVIAVGFYQQSKIPSFSQNCSPDIYQIHSEQYRNPGMIPEGAVLVVGSAQSGSQIAEELNEHGREVYLSVSEAGRFPRRYRGEDADVWMERMGYFERTVDQLPPGQARFAASAHGTGKNGGHTINMHQFTRDGINLVGRIRDIQNSLVTIEPGLHDCLRKADQFEEEFVQEVDRYIEENHLSAPEETLPHLDDGFRVEELTELRLDEAGISSIIWATGYTYDFSWVRCSVLDDDGLPVNDWGVTPCPGLYFIGMPFLHSGKSGLIYGCAEDTAHIAKAIVKNSEIMMDAVSRR
jgi:putative flavoprotein involved in K+ transport